MIHYLYFGHFDLEGNFVRFDRDTSYRPALFRPVVNRPLEMEVLQKLFVSHEITIDDIPESWGMRWNDDGYFVVDRDTKNIAVLAFLRELVQRTGCMTADYSALSLS